MKKPTTLSYATWNPNDVRDLNYPLNLKLKNLNWVIVGLNPSRMVSFPENFHKGGFDEWHKYAFALGELSGASMLDLVDDVEPDSRKITCKWRNDPVWKKKHIDRFTKEMKFLFKNHKPKLMCIGKNTFELFHCESGITNLFSQMHVVKNPNGIRVKNAKQEYLKMVNDCAVGQCAGHD